MKKTMVVICFLLVGCAHSNNTVKEITGSWVGVPVEEVVAQWGFPTSERIALGHKLVTWHREGVVYDNYQRPVYVACDRTFEVDPQGLILKAEWRGNCNTEYATFGRKRANP